MDGIKRYYVTFGTDERYPFEGGYLIILAHSAKEANGIYRSQYPDRTEGVLNYAFMYVEDVWERDRMYEKYYSGMAPHTVLSAA